MAPKKQTTKKPAAAKGNNHQNSKLIIAEETPVKETPSETKAAPVESPKA